VIILRAKNEKRQMSTIDCYPFLLVASLWANSCTSKRLFITTHHYYSTLQINRFTSSDYLTFKFHET